MRIEMMVPAGIPISPIQAKTSCTVRPYGWSRHKPMTLSICSAASAPNTHDDGRTPDSGFLETHTQVRGRHGQREQRPARRREELQNGQDRDERRPLQRARGHRPRTVRPRA
ncbi:MAG: hypothetical protein ACT4QD_23815 [Acidobacteriota bacterium]